LKSNYVALAADIGIAIIKFVAAAFTRSSAMISEEVILQLIAIFKQNLTTQEITESIQRVTNDIQKEFPRIKRIFIEPV